jgi:hypothetical protein
MCWIASVVSECCSIGYCPFFLAGGGGGGGGGGVVIVLFLLSLRVFL